MRNAIRTSILIAIVGATSLGQEPASRPAEVYTSVLVTEVEVISGKWPDDGMAWSRSFGFQPETVWQATFVSPEEGFLIRAGRLPGSETARLVARSPAGADVTALLTVETDGGQTSQVGIRIPKPLLGNATRQDFMKAARDHFRGLADAGLPGAAWFRYRLAAAEAELPPPPPDEAPVPNRRRPTVRELRRGSEDDVSETYDLFSGGRAVSENLRLDRELTPIEGGEPTIAIGEIEGITTKAFDWKAAIEKLNPAKDPLAAKIPDDQHAAFFPSVAALAATLDALDGHAPILQAAEDRFEDAAVRAFYEKQLGISAKGLAASVVGKGVTSIAVTGSDPYFRTGTDIAVLLECSHPEVVAAYLASRHAVMRTGPDVGAVTGDIQGQEYSGIVTVDRTISSYFAVLGGTVVVTNSLEQLKHVVEAAQGKVFTLSASPEYTFFRNRYVRTDAAETAFLLLTDATIRRWCGPRWRIGDSRRTRAAAQLADLTARHADAIVGGPMPAGAVSGGPLPAGLGSLSWTAEGIHSGAYGNLRFLEPIVEMDVGMVTQMEHDSYRRFRETYQQRWVNFFDPIAIRLELAQGRMGVDVTVMPLVESTDYRWMMEMAREVRFGPTACDPHGEAAAQLVIAIDAAAAAMASWERGARRLAPKLETLALSWMKGGVSVSLDQDPMLDQLMARRRGGDFETLTRLPLLLTAEVKDPVALTLFLTGIRATMEDTGVGAIRWTRGHHRDVDTMTISGIPGFGRNEDSISIRYAIVDGLFFVSLREDVLQHAIDRVVDRRAGKTAAGAPWLGESVALRVTKSFADFAADWSRTSWRESQQFELAWRALPILNEWRRLFPDQDPVSVHEKLFKVRLLDPAGGKYVVDREKNRIVSETYGHPCETRPGPQKPAILEGFKEGRGGLTFEHDGVRARLVIEREAK